MVPSNFLISLCVIVTLMGCVTDNSSPNYGVKTLAGTYSTQDSSVIISYSYVPEPYCDGDVIKQPDRILVNRVDTTKFVVSANRLVLTSFPDSMKHQSGAILRLYFKYERIIGSGTGLEGAWRHKGISYDVLAGSLSVTDQISLNSSGLYIDAHFSGYTTEFLDGNYSIYTDGKTAAAFLKIWNLELELELPTDGWQSRKYSDSAKYDITVSILDMQTVQLKGRKTGETVWVKITPEGDKFYSSDNPDHAEHKYLSNPNTCPNLNSPFWYEDFKEHNIKSSYALPKSGQIPPNSPPRHKSSLFPLNPRPSFLN